MTDRKGMVINTHKDGWAEVMVQNESCSSSCESGCGCSVGTQRPKLATRVLNRVGAKKGDVVAVRMDTVQMFKSIATLYLLPIAGLLAGAVAGANLDNSYPGSPMSLAVLLSLAGLGLGFLSSVLISRRMASNSKFSPVITRVINIRETRANYARADI